MGARKLIDEAHGLAEKRGYNQSKWSADAGYAINGQTVSRIMKNGDCRLSTYVALLDTIGYELVIQESRK